MILACPFCHVKVGKTDSSCRVCHRVMTRHCPSCAEDISVLANLCKYCGEATEPINEQATPVARAVPELATVAPAEAPAREAVDVEFVGEVRSVAWENPSKRGRFGSWWSTWADSQFNPSKFWAKLPTEGGHGAAHSYSWYLTAQALVLFMPVFALFGTAIGISESIPVWGYAAGAAAYLALFPLAYVTIAISNYVTATFWHVYLKLLGAKGTYEGTLRIVGYNAGAGVWGMIPLVGGVVGGIMGTIGNYQGFRAVHGMSKGRAFFAAMTPVVLTALAVVGLIALCLSVDGGGGTIGCGPRG